MIITSDEILGREAVDPAGEVLGTVVMLHVENSKKSIIGITIDQGFMSPDLFIGNDYIKKFGVDAVFLNKVPEQKYLGLPVISSTGESIGKVKEVIKEDHVAKYIRVITGYRLFKQKTIKVPLESIKEAGHSIVLKGEKDNYIGKLAA